jgi:hypothetical protein
MKFLKNTLRLTMLFCLAGVPAGMIASRPYIFVLSVLGLVVNAFALVQVCRAPRPHRSHRGAAHPRATAWDRLKSGLRLGVLLGMLGVPATIILDRPDLLALSLLGMGAAAWLLFQLCLTVPASLIKRWLARRADSMPTPFRPGPGDGETCYSPAAPGNAWPLSW